MSSTTSDDATRKPPATRSDGGPDPSEAGAAARLFGSTGLRLGWGELGAAVIVGVTLAILGGAPFHPMAELSHMASAWTMAVPQFGLPLVLALQVADRAVERGRSALLSYGAVVPLVILAGSFVIWRPFWPWLQPWNFYQKPPSLLQCFGEGTRLWLPVTLGVVAYAHWRQQQRSQRRIAQRRLQQAQRRQQVQAAQLLALQARLEPQLLFDTLERVARLAESDAGAAEALLAELIALLRAMLPEPDRPGSTVEREFALVRAYARVTGDATLLPPALELRSTPEAAHATLAPLVLLPLLRALARASPGPWQVMANGAPDGRPGLRLSLGEQTETAPACSTALAALRGLAGDVQAQARAHLAAVHGAAARMTLIDTGLDPHWLIDIPPDHGTGPDR